ncbi:Metallo-hydrolase [Venustampulla echinocandica]|uniref:Metallo-hydrolase n=1 Tax=Venustampulla echinocandica TaxID=2656787 RepID=A0A370U1G2_9HELO|nr:Metallo-hydrolase [Venustampulla echinocandica]RDL41619.1 Metallo-hydrolase [Venustampulla echinocandica]
MIISIQVIQTGSVRVRPTAYQQPANRSVLLRRLRFLADRQWHPSNLPIYSFLITHPEGNILFDTGMSPHCNQSNYFPIWAMGTKMATQMHIEAHEGMASQLKEMGIEPKDLKAVVLSHLHHDHAGGLEDLAEAPIFMSKEHWKAFKGPTYAAIEGCAPNHWPKDFAPKFLVPSGTAIGPFENSYPITSDGKVVAVDTPGHAPGHVSLIVFADDATFFLTGDATYGLELLDKEETDGINDDPLRAVETLRKIKEFTRQQPVIVLPSHDTKTIENLKLKTAFSPSNL